MTTITKTQREYVESIVYKFMSAADPTEANTNHYKEKFSSMDDKAFIRFISKDLPYKFHVSPFKTEVNMNNIKNALDVIGIPLLEKVNMNYLYKNKDGVPVNTKECMTGFLSIKKMKQFITKKNSMSTDITNRDMKTGLLTGGDKNAITSDREMESLFITGLYDTIEELSRSRADSMDAKSNMYNNLSTIGRVSLADCKADIDDSLSKNLINVYFTGALIKTNIISDTYETPRTLADKELKISRI